MQIQQTLHGVVNLQQGALCIAVQALGNFLGGGTQIDHEGMRSKLCPICWPEHGPSAGRNHHLALISQQTCNDLLLDVPEGLFTMLRKKITNAASKALLYDRVRIDKR